MIDPRELPGFDPTFEPAGLPARSDVPSVSAFLPGESGGLSAGAHPSGSKMDTVVQLLKVALPALAAGYSFGGGQLGSFTNGYLQASDMVGRQRDREEQRQYRIDSLRRQIADEATRRSHEQRLEATAMERNALLKQQQIAAAQKERDTRIQAALQRALDKAAENPAFFAKVNEVGPENFALQVDGVGNVSLKEVFDKLGVIKGPNGYAYGKGVETKSSDLVPVPGPDGKPIYGEKKPGARVYERPRQPEKPPKATTRAYTWKDDDPTSDTFGQSFRIVEDEQGNIVKKTPLTGGAAPKPVPSHAPAGKTKIGRFIVEPG